MTPFQVQLKSLQDNQKLLSILLFSFVTIVIWITISLVTSQKRTAISPESQALAKPLNPSINTDVLNQIEQKRSFQATELQEFPIYVVFKERGNTSVFDQGGSSTVQVQPDTINSLNEISTSSGSAQTSTTPTPEPLPSPTPPVTEEIQ